MEKLKSILKNKKNLLIIFLAVIAILILSLWISIGSASFITKEKAQNIFYKNIQASKEYIKIKQVKLHRLKKQYNIDFTYKLINNKKFTMVLNALNGKIVKNTLSEYNAKHSSTPRYTFDYIDEESAKKLIAENLNTEVDKILFKSIKFTKKKDSAIYDAKIEYKNLAGTYKIDAISGRILDGYSFIGPIE